MAAAACVAPGAEEALALVAVAELVPWLAARVLRRHLSEQPFATVVWSCDFYDKDHRVVGHSPLIFHVVPWGAVVVDTQYVYSNGMFQSGSCQLVSTEAVTRDNERLYRGGPQQLNLGNDNPMARVYFIEGGRG
jgi:hypothetical protein